MSMKLVTWRAYTSSLRSDPSNFTEATQGARLAVSVFKNVRHYCACKQPFEDEQVQIHVSGDAGRVWHARTAAIPPRSPGDPSQDAGSVERRLVAWWGPSPSAGVAVARGVTTSKPVAL
eukprot:CAMPEP_0115828092 /NCGR_PEP_ID=MMETSP0287-20121206/394_1 /TAXON_ID=412157 /ORGANISM="Chrysochromulina rotalis, Strain UIO044" /LENGTH=118 /DNA_ID=CAMNT_0003281295 /DNA_START=156 /DNA_END=510 /DNA_ORIENTATION=+